MILVSTVIIFNSRISQLKLSLQPQDITSKHHQRGIILIFVWAFKVEEIKISFIMNISSRDEINWLFDLIFKIYCKIIFNIIIFLFFGKGSKAWKVKPAVGWWFRKMVVLHFFGVNSTLLVIWLSSQHKRSITEPCRHS